MADINISLLIIYYSIGMLCILWAMSLPLKAIAGVKRTTFTFVKIFQWKNQKLFK